MISKLAIATPVLIHCSSPAPTVTQLADDPLLLNVGLKALRCYEKREANVLESAQ